MKKIILGTIVAVFLTFGFTTGEFWKDQPTSSIPGLTIEKAHASDVNPNTMALGEKPAQDNSIFSSSTIISLSLVVIGIVAFRRNTDY